MIRDIHSKMCSCTNNVKRRVGRSGFRTRRGSNAAFTQNIVFKRRRRNLLLIFGDEVTKIEVFQRFKPERK